MTFVCQIGETAISTGLTKHGEYCDYLGWMQRILASLMFLKFHPD